MNKTARVLLFIVFYWGGVNVISDAYALHRVKATMKIQELKITPSYLKLPNNNKTQYFTVSGGVKNDPVKVKFESDSSNHYSTSSTSLKSGNWISTKFDENGQLTLNVLCGHKDNMLPISDKYTFLYHDRYYTIDIDFYASGNI